MVANVVEKDVKRLSIGMPAQVEVDAFPGEKFMGRVARIAPVFDPQTRTAEMEIEIPNASYRLKPGMYSRVDLTIASRDNAMTVPSNAVVDLQGKIGVFVASTAGPQQASNPPAQGTTGAGAADAPMTARFQPVEVGIRQGERVEITSGLTEGARVITTGATALKDGDRIVASNQAPGSGRGQAPQGSQVPQGGSR
jgi:RND family efflux transporter MFP subunit